MESVKPSTQRFLVVITITSLFLLSFLIASVRQESVTQGIVFFVDRAPAGLAYIAFLFVGIPWLLYFGIFSFLKPMMVGYVFKYDDQKLILFSGRTVYFEDVSCVKMVSWPVIDYCLILDSGDRQHLMSYLAEGKAEDWEVIFTSRGIKLERFGQADEQP